MLGNWFGSKWDWQIFCKSNLEDTRYPGCFGADGDITYLQWMISAWGWTLSVALLGLLLALVAGSLVGVARTVPNRALRLFGEAWTELFRNVPLLVQLFLWYFVAPKAIPGLQSVPSLVLVVFALGFFTSARVAEQVKAGIETLSTGQRNAGLAMGLTLAQTYRYVLLPVAFRIVIPPLTSEAMGIIKNSSVAFAVSISELITFAMQAQEETSRGVEIYLAVTGLYFVSSIVVNQVAVLIERLVRVPGVAGVEVGR